MDLSFKTKEPGCAWPSCGGLRYSDPSTAQPTRPSYVRRRAITGYVLFALDNSSNGRAMCVLEDSRSVRRFAGPRPQATYV